VNKEKHAVLDVQLQHCSNLVVITDKLVFRRSGKFTCIFIYLSDIVIFALLKK
jgi:hypothetical protein